MSMRDHTKILHIRAVPKAKRQMVKCEIGETGKPLYKVYVTAAPEDGKANKAVIALLAKELGVPKSALTILKGETSRNKLIEISE